MSDSAMHLQSQLQSETVRAHASEDRTCCACLQPLNLQNSLLDFNHGSIGLTLLYIHTACLERLSIPAHRQLYRRVLCQEGIVTQPTMPDPLTGPDWCINQAKRVKSAMQQNGWRRFYKEFREAATTIPTTLNLLPENVVSKEQEQRARAVVLQALAAEIRNTNHPTVPAWQRSWAGCRHAIVYLTNKTIKDGELHTMITDWLTKNEQTLRPLRALLRHNLNVYIL